MVIDKFQDWANAVTCQIVNLHMSDESAPARFQRIADLIASVLRLAVSEAV